MFWVIRTYINIAGVLVTFPKQVYSVIAQVKRNVLHLFAKCAIRDFSYQTSIGINGKLKIKIPGENCVISHQK